MSQLWAPYACMSLLVRPAGSTLLSPFLRMTTWRARWVRLHIFSKNNKEIICERNKYKKSHELVAIISAEVYRHHLPPIIIIWCYSSSENHFTRYPTCVNLIPSHWSQPACVLLFQVWQSQDEYNYYLPRWRRYHFMCHINHGELSFTRSWLVY